MNTPNRNVQCPDGTIFNADHVILWRVEDEQVIAYLPNNVRLEVSEKRPDAAAALATLHKHLSGAPPEIYIEDGGKERLSPSVRCRPVPLESGTSLVRLADERHFIFLTYSDEDPCMAGLLDPDTDEVEHVHADELALNFGLAEFQSPAAETKSKLYVP